MLERNYNRKFSEFFLENVGSLRTFLVSLCISSVVFRNLRQSSGIFRNLQKRSGLSASGRKLLVIVNKITLPFFESFLFPSG